MAFTTIVETLNHLHCARCGMIFGISPDFEQRRRNDHKDFYCPSGHANVYNGKSEAERLKDELTRERARRDQAEADARQQRSNVRMLDRQVAARKAVATKLRKRIAAGKCPCCHATFRNLESHMKSQHPKWSPENAAVAIAEKLEVAGA